MTILVRALVLSAAAAAALVVMTLGDDGTADANIGAGLAVFTVLVVGGFGWALLDGLDRHGRDREERPRLGELALRWAVAAVLTALAITVGTSLLDDGGLRENLEPGSVAFFAGLVLLPALAGLGLGLVARGGRPGATVRAPSSGS